MILQVPWKQLEDNTRKRAENMDTPLYVITGLIFNDNIQWDYYSQFKNSFFDCDVLRSRDGTAVAAEYYKLLLWCSSSEVGAEYIFMKHENSNNVIIYILHK